MQAFARHLIAPTLLVVALALMGGCSSTPQRDRSNYCVSLAQYNTHGAAESVQSLHSIQIGDIAGLRSYLETRVAEYVVVLGEAARDPQTTPEERGHMWALLRVIAVQNEKFPAAAINSDPQTAEILQAAIADNPSKAAQLRRQDWSKPMWTNWVD